jgi:hypothetical protein
MIKIIVEILSASLFIILGALFYFSEHSTLYGFPVSRHTGTLILFIGVFWIFYVLLNRKRVIYDWKKSKIMEKVLICPKCLKPEWAIDHPSLKCPNCDSDLEQMDGFYERHPDLKEIQTQPKMD